MHLERQVSRFSRSLNCVVVLAFARIGYLGRDLSVLLFLYATLLIWWLQSRCSYYLVRTSPISSQPSFMLCYHGCHAGLAAVPRAVSFVLQRFAIVVQRIFLYIAPQKGPVVFLSRTSRGSASQWLADGALMQERRVEFSVCLTQTLHKNGLPDCRCSIHGWKT
jgi:hypothetical protein